MLKEFAGSAIANSSQGQQKQSIAPTVAVERLINKQQGSKNSQMQD